MNSGVPTACSIIPARVKGSRAAWDGNIGTYDLDGTSRTVTLLNGAPYLSTVEGVSCIKYTASYDFTDTTSNKTIGWQLARTAPNIQSQLHQIFSLGANSASQNIIGNIANSSGITNYANGTAYPSCGVGFTGKV